MSGSSSSRSSSSSGSQTSCSSQLERISCLDEFQEVARGKLDKSVFDYFCHGSDDELTLKWNKQMISHKFYLNPRVMCDVSKVDLNKYIFGDRLSMPIGVSPMAMHKMLHPEGELATIRACSRQGALMVLSLFSTSSLESVALEEPHCTKWQNIYILKRRQLTQNVVERAVRYNYRALVVTCDAPVLGNRRYDVRNKFTLGTHKLENIDDSQIQELKEHSSSIFDPSVSWQELAELKKNVGNTIRVIAKGIMTAEDAELALGAGVDAIMVSNHGGRQLDGSRATIEALPEVVAAVRRRCPVLVDGGFSTGADVLKGLALGADMVFVGRPIIWALASFGQPGVERALQMIREELRKAMMLCGCNSLEDINPAIIGERK